MSVLYLFLAIHRGMDGRYIAIFIVMMHATYGPNPCMFLLIYVVSTVMDIP